MCTIVKGGSGFAAKHSLIVHDGVIDPDYRGEIKVVIHNFSDEDYTSQKGDKVAQLLFIETVSPVFVQKSCLSTSVRGEGGLGYTGQQTKHLCFE